MRGYQHTADGCYQGDGTQEYRCLMEGQFLLVLMNEPIHHKYTIIHTNTKDKGGDDDTDEIKADVKQHHGS
jgi:hypothetical protein